MEKSAAEEPEIPALPPGELELPSDDGEPMETGRHRQQMVLLIQSLKFAWADRHDYFVGGNMFVYFSETQVKKNDFRGPDVFVVLDTTDRDRRSWVAWGEDGKLPEVVIELLSDRTRQIDRGEKMQIYSRLWRTAEYYLYDPWSHEFEGYRLDPLSAQYAAMAPDELGDFPCHRLGLKLGIREGSFEGVQTRWLRWLDQHGEVLQTSEEAYQSQKIRADDLERRVLELEGKLKL
ncbi:MAG TPA: Uma2 family endonuclease [Polyangiaceae bacterium]|nr:Uma2 family endonuclease [Polyangiaceae bacterium]